MFREVNPSARLRINPSERHEDVILALYQVRGKLQRESGSETLDSPVSSTGQACQARNDKQRKWNQINVKKRQIHHNSELQRQIT